MENSMGLSDFDRLFEAREKQLAAKAAEIQPFDPFFPAQETQTTPVKYDPMGENTFKPATGDGK